MDPIPDREVLERFYPLQYWSETSSHRLRAFENFYRRLVLRDHIGFVARAAAGVSRNEGKVRLLDIGCGSGLLLSLLARRGFDVRGFDPSRDASAAARARGVEVVVGETIESAGFTVEAFDVVTLFHVIEHVADPRNVLREVSRILRPGGRMIVQVPNTDSWQSRLFGTRWYGLDVPRHVINYSHTAIRHLLADCGFRIVRTRHFNLRDNAAAFASSLCPPLDPVSRRVKHARSGEPAAEAWIKHVAYAGVMAAAYPLIVAESLFQRGGTVMLEAERT